MESSDVLLVLNNTSSPSRVIDFVKVGEAFGFRSFGFTKIYGAAAQSGIPDVFKYAYKNGLSVVIFPSIEDLVDVLKPDNLVLITGSGESIENVDFSKYKRNVIIFDGSEAGFDPLEKKMGRQVYLEVLPGKLPVIAELTLSLYLIGRRSK